MTLLLDTPAGENGLVVQRCGLWGYNNSGVVSGDEACAVDPGIPPAEVAAFREALEAGGRRVTRVVLTHSHHDHIRGWDAFPGAEVIAPEVVAAKEEGPRARILAGKARFDERLEDPAPGFRYPRSTTPSRWRRPSASGGSRSRPATSPGTPTARASPSSPRSVRS